MPRSRRVEEQIPVSGRLLDGLGVQIVPVGPLHLPRVVAVDQTREIWLRVVAGVLSRELVESEGGWDQAHCDIEAALE